MTTIRDLIADVLDEARLGYRPASTTYESLAAADALLASPLADIIDLAAENYWMGERSPAVRALLADWRTTR